MDGRKKDVEIETTPEDDESDEVISKRIFASYWYLDQGAMSV